MLSAAERALFFVLPTRSERVPAPSPEPDSAGRTVVAAPCQGAAHRFWGSRWWWLVLALVGRRVVLLQHTSGDAPSLTDCQAVLFRPGPDIT